MMLMETRNTTRHWRLRTAAPILKCAPDVIQVGLDRRWAIRLDGLDTKEIRWLQAAAAKQNQPRRMASSFGVTESRAIEICSTLARSGFLLPSSPQNPTAQDLLAATEKVCAGGRTDLPALSALRPDGDGQQTLNRRALAAVGITSIGRLGAQVAILLAQAGVGRLQIMDNEKVTNDDIGPYQANEVGKRRHIALARRLADLGLSPEITHYGTPNLSISIETGTQGATYFGLLQQEATPHLAVAVGEAEVEVGPFVLPSRSACAHCLQLTRADDDEHWGQLLSEICALPLRPTETVLVQAAAALITAEALTFIDGGRPQLINQLATIALPTATPSFVPVYPNDDCGCTSVPPPLR